MAKVRRSERELFHMWLRIALSLLHDRRTLLAGIAGLDPAKNWRSRLDRLERFIAKVGPLILIKGPSPFWRWICPIGDGERHAALQEIVAGVSRHDDNVGCCERADHRRQAAAT